ncbi:MAG: hypothetical protein AABW79_01395 [Nanoarchaeota archaeon]
MNYFYFLAGVIIAVALVFGIGNYYAEKVLLSPEESLEFSGDLELNAVTCSSAANPSYENPDLRSRCLRCSFAASSACTLACLAQDDYSYDTCYNGFFGVNGCHGRLFKRCMSNS